METPQGNQNPVDELESLRSRIASLEREVAKQKRIEEALQKSEERYRTLVEAMNEGLGVQDEAGFIIYVNEKLARMLGYSRTEMLGRPFSDFVSESQRDLVLDFLLDRRRMLEGPIELDLVAKDRRPCIALVSPAPILGKESDLRGTLAVFTDITRLKEAERALAEERNLLRTLMDSVPDYTYIKDRESRFISTNTAHLKCLGVKSLSDVIGRTDFHFFPRELAQIYYDDEQKVMAGGKPLLNKIEEAQMAGGEKRWLMTFKAPLRDSAGIIIGLVGVSRDISDLRRAERALRESEDRFRLILENSRDIVYKLNFTEDSYEYVSPSSLKVSGFGPSELIAMGLEGFYERVHPDERAQLQRYRLERVTWDSNGEMPSAVEYRLLHQDGAYRWMAECAGILRNEQGVPISEIGTIRDITESKTAEQAIRNALRMEATATLAGGIAHDFNNLMVGVLGNAELLQMRLGAQDLDTARMLNIIAGSAQKAGELAQQMLAFAHGGKYQPSVINFNTTIEETMWLEKRKIPDRILVESNLAPSLCNTLADPAQMSQVVLNLLMNAIEAIDGEGKVTVTTSNARVDQALAEKYGLQTGDYVRLDVHDTGFGMNAETQSHVFEPFFTTKFQGRGLGLAAVYGIVTNHGGCITVDSETGKGSTFTVFLPAVEQKTTRGAKTGTSTTLPKGTETIMLVDDEAVVLEVTRSILERLGYNVICALNGQEAVELARKYDGDISLVLLDMAMPVMGGSQAYPLIRDLRPNIKAIIYSGYELDPAAQAVLDAGANDYIQKPFRTRMLATKVRQVLDQ